MKISTQLGCCFAVSFAAKAKTTTVVEPRGLGLIHTGYSAYHPLYSDADIVKVSGQTDEVTPDNCYWTHVPQLQRRCLPPEMFYRAKGKGEKDQLGFPREAWVPGPAVVNMPDPFTHNSCRYVARDKRRGGFRYCFETAQERDAYVALSRRVPQINDQASQLQHARYGDNFRYARSQAVEAYKNLPDLLPHLPIDKAVAQKAERLGELEFFLRSYGVTT